MAELYLWQDAAVALVEYACGWVAGRSKDDPVYLAVVEHRDVPPWRAHYSSCGDLAHWLLERLEIDEPWVNRESLGHYRDRLNVWDLASCPIHSLPGGPEWQPEPGDILEIWNAATGSDAHVCVVLDGSLPGRLRTGNYGAGGMSAAATPGAKIADSPFVHTSTGWVLGTRHVQRVVRLADVIRLAKKPPDLTGAEVTDELIDALGAKWSAA